MKKQYSKPDILFESFTLSTSIAGSCETVLDNPSANQCGIKMGFKTYFTESVAGCSTDVIDGSGDLNGLCYHVPFDTNNVFNS